MPRLRRQAGWTLPERRLLVVGVLEVCGIVPYLRLISLRYDGVCGTGALKATGSVRWAGPGRGRSVDTRSLPSVLANAVSVLDCSMASWCRAGAAAP